MSEIPATTEFRLSLYATPSDLNREVFYSVVRAGHLLAGTEHRIERSTYPGHELIFCRAGAGWARIGGRQHRVGAGELLWVNCFHPHAYGAVPQTPWELYWVRADGLHLDRICKILSAESQPVFPHLGAAAVERQFTAIFAQMQTGRPEAPAWIHAELAKLIALLFQARRESAAAGQPDIPPRLHKAWERMRLYYHLPLRVAELATLAGMSPSHFSREFKAVFGTSPIDWLRRERISQAKRRLIESDDSIKEVARQTGFSDQYYFSKDFKQLTSLTPTEFRHRERGGTAAPLRTPTRSARR
jgi:AraC-like DNA-binding protein